MTMIGRKDFITFNIGQSKPPKQVEREIHYIVIGDFVGEEGRGTQGFGGTDQCRFW